jgi:hypothetical protein
VSIEEVGAVAARRAVDGAGGGGAAWRKKRRMGEAEERRPMKEKDVAWAEEETSHGGRHRSHAISRTLG